MPEQQFQQPQQIELKSIDTLQLIELLRRYNHKFGMGASMARLLAPIFNRQENATDTDEENKDSAPGDMGEQNAEELLDYDELKREVEPILTSTGLELQPVNPGWTMNTNQDTHAGVEMRLNLKDGKQFVNYLQSLEPDTITESQKEGLKEVTSILNQQFTDEYNLSDPGDERLIELMGNLSSIISEYKRLDSDGNNLTQSITKLEEYLNIARKGYLREFRQAEILNLDKSFTNEGFTLRWHVDCDQDLLKRKWKDVIDVLHAIHSNQNAQKDIYPQAINTANDAIVAAIAGVSAWEEKEGYEERKKDFLAILQTTKSKLAEF